MKLSIIIPVYNEKKTLIPIIRSVKTSELLEGITGREIILVDDYSTDGSRDILRQISDPEIHIYYHDRNLGKGAALRTGFSKATGDILLIQDADLEYDPREYPILIQPIFEDKADVVYGSRFMGGKPHRILYFWHMLANRILTLISNMFSDLNLTDMETCYKVFNHKAIRDLQIEENRFGFEPEITAKIGSLARSKGIRVYEVGVSYYGRTYLDGKKIGWKDAIRAFWCIFEYNDSPFAHFVKYGLNGLLVALSQYIIIFLFIEKFGFHSSFQQNIANAISIEISIIIGFLLHSLITWRTRFRGFRDWILKFTCFHMITGISFLIRVIIFYILLNIGMNYKVNTLIGIGIAVIFNFIGYKNLLFKDNQKSVYENK